MMMHLLYFSSQTAVVEAEEVETTTAGDVGGATDQMLMKPQRSSSFDAVAIHKA